LALIREEAGDWSLKVESFNAPLRRGLQMTLEANAITYAVARTTDERKGSVHCALVRWEYRIKDADEAELLLLVRETNTDGSELNKPISDHKGMAALILAVVVGMILAAVFGDWYAFPDHLWTFLGHRARPLGILFLAILFASVIPARLRLKGRTDFIGLFWSALLLWIGLAMGFLWFHFTRTPAYVDGSDKGYIQFGHEITDRLKLEHWPLLLAALPWAAIVFKALGFEVAEKTSEAILKTAKNEE
jgi:hypothetical protein